MDELGGLEDAITAAAELADLTEDKQVDLPKQKDLFQQIMEDLSGQARAWVVSDVLGEDAALLRQFEQVRNARSYLGIQARMPFDLIVE